MEERKFKVIPGYERYSVDQYGLVIDLKKKIILDPDVVDGYFQYSVSDSPTERLSAHRAVALTWVANNNPEYNIVNHKNGWPVDNWYGNLEWTNYSGNNYHAVNNGLRDDNLRCKIRNFDTKEIMHFPSIAQASEYMGLPKDTHYPALCPKLFGKLIKNKFEFKFEYDHSPWFYEARENRINPTRFIVTVKFKDGTVKELYSNKDLLKQFQLYKSEERSVYGLVGVARRLHPDIEISIRDGYVESRFRQLRHTKKSKRMPIRAKSNDTHVDFSSLTKCANYFNVDRSSILYRLDNDKELDGWTFTKEPQ